MKYTVCFDIIASYTVDVEADDVPRAIALAESIPVRLANGDGDTVGYIYECSVYRVDDEQGNTVEGDPYM